MHARGLVDGQHQADGGAVELVLLHVGLERGRVDRVQAVREGAGGADDGFGGGEDRAEVLGLARLVLLAVGSVRGGGGRWLSSPVLFSSSD